MGISALNTQHILLTFFALTIPCQTLASGPDAPAPALPQPQQAPAAFDGRVFFSAAERRALEIKPVPVPPAPIPSPTATSPKRRFDGTLWRNGRIVALWFDGDPVDPAAEPTIRIGDGIPVTMVSGRRQILSPGQNWPLQKSEP